MKAATFVPASAADQQLLRHLERRRRPGRGPLPLDREDGAADLLGPEWARQLGQMAPAWHTLSAFDGRSDAFGGQYREMGERVLLGARAHGHIIKIGNARDDAAVALAIDHRPIPNPVHRPLHAEQLSAPRDATLHASEDADNRS